MKYWTSAFLLFVSLLCPLTSSAMMIVGLDDVSPASLTERSFRNLERAVRNIHTRASQGVGGAVFDMSLYAVSTTVSIAGTVSITNRLGLLFSRSTTNKVVYWSAQVVKIGAVGMLSGAVIAVFEATPAESATLTDYFLTPEGFAEYLQASPEQMLAYAQMDPRLANFVIRVSNSLDQMNNEVTSPDQAH